jgi:hypothetical protein
MVSREGRVAIINAITSTPPSPMPGLQLSLSGQHHNRKEPNLLELGMAAEAGGNRSGSGLPNGIRRETELEESPRRERNERA